MGKEFVIGHFIHSNGRIIKVILPDMKNILLGKKINKTDDEIDFRDVLDFSSGFIPSEEYCEHFKQKNLISIEKLILELVEKIVKTELGIQKQQDQTAFFNALTDKEKQAFKLVKEEIEKSYNNILSISYLVSQSNLSRSVFNNLFSKMALYNIAKIFNKGVKGTYIKFI